jgi:hypothetical protein
VEDVDTIGGRTQSAIGQKGHANSQPGRALCDPMGHRSVGLGATQRWNLCSSAGELTAADPVSASEGPAAVVVADLPV